MASTNSLDMTSDPQPIIGTREFDAPRDLVFAAFTDPKHPAQWWGPNGFTATTSSFDMVYCHGGGADVEPVQLRQSIACEDFGARTRLTWRGDFPPAAERDRVIKEYGAGKGLVQTLARLAAYVSAAGV
jgi:Activator of Hsp90 ATPase homolog 1-like protein